MVGKGWRACLRKWNGGFFESQEGERRCRRQGREGGVAQVEGDSNRHPIAIQSRSNRPNSTTPTRIVASNCPLFPQILCSDFIPKSNLTLPGLQQPFQPHAPPATHLPPPTPRHQQPSATFTLRAPLLPSSHLKEPHPKRPAQATLFLPSNLLAPSHTSPWNSNLYPSIPSVFPLFPRASERRVLLIVGVCQTFSHLHIFSSSHPHIFTSSHLHIFSSSHLLIFTSSHIFSSSHIHIVSSSHLLIFTSAHLHIFSSSHPHILTFSHLLSLTSSHPHIFKSSHLHIFSSSHLLIFTSSHLHILTSSHLLTFTYSHLHIFSSPHPHIFASSHPHILTSSHPHIFTSSHLHIFTFSLALLLSCPLARSFFSISLLKARGSANEMARNATLSREMRFDRQKLK